MDENSGKASVFNWVHRLRKASPQPIAQTQMAMGLLRNTRMGAGV
ncbi:MAG TPA: hypothetical protein PKJ47_09775 [Candidatus Limiplasma sp.]|nr:hypothetical protein [Candidatus Limiplasma sp.]